jgi:hypothetical protein
MCLFIIWTLIIECTVFQPTDDYDCLCELMNHYLKNGTTQTPTGKSERRGKGERSATKKNDDFIGGDDESLEPVSFLFTF